MQSGPAARPPAPADPRDDVTGPGTGPATGTGTGVLRLREPRYRVHSRAILWWTLRPLLFWLVVDLGQAAVLIFVSQPPGFVPVTLTVSIVLTVVHMLVMPQWRYRVHRWEATGEAVYTRSGWINQEWRVAPVSRIQTVDTKRGPLEQLFGRGPKLFLSLPLRPRDLTDKLIAVKRVQLIERNNRNQ